MAKNVAFVALIFFAVVGLAAATASPATSADATAATADNSTGGNAIGSVSAGAASDAAPVGAPVPDGAFPTVHTASGSRTAALQVTTVAGAVAVAGVVGSFFF